MSASTAHVCLVSIFIHTRLSLAAQTNRKNEAEKIVVHSTRRFYVCKSALSITMVGVRIIREYWLIYTLNAPFRVLFVRRVGTCGYLDRQSSMD